MTEPKRRYWSESELDVLRAQFPVRATREIALQIGRTESATAAMAGKLGLQKSEIYLASDGAGRIKPGEKRSEANQFKRGHATWNKGTHFVAGGRSIETRFQAGGLPHTTRPVGSLRITSEGVLEQKFREHPGNNSKRWVGVHRLVWEREHGPVPLCSVVAFRAGMHTTVCSEITLDRIELITRRELMLRNNVHNLPLELREVIQLKGVLQRKINKRTRTA